MSNGSKSGSGSPTIKLRQLPQRFKDSVVLIAGANDRGIGGAIAERLAGEGASLMLIDLDQPQRLLGRLKRRNAVVRWHRGNVTDQESMNRIVAESVAEFGRLDVVVNSAGVSHFAPFDELTDEQWEVTFNVNVKGAACVIRAALPHLSAPGGVIVNIASALGMNACSGNTLYGSSKAALIAMTNSLAMELAPQKIRAVCVAPAIAHTPMLHEFAQNFSEDTWNRVTACHPLGTGSRYDVADAVAFLASSDAGWITGSTLPMGWTHSFPLPLDALRSGSTGKSASTETSSIQKACK